MHPPPPPSPNKPSDGKPGYYARRLCGLGTGTGPSGGVLCFLLDVWASAGKTTERVVLTEGGWDHKVTCTGHFGGW